jgi:hypothetical protein
VKNPLTADDHSPGPALPLPRTRLLPNLVVVKRSVDATTDEITSELQEALKS